MKFFKNLVINLKNAYKRQIVEEKNSKLTEAAHTGKQFRDYGIRAANIAGNLEIPHKNPHN